MRTILINKPFFVCELFLRNKLFFVCLYWWDWGLYSQYLAIFMCFFLFSVKPPPNEYQVKYMGVYQFNLRFDFFRRIK